MMTSTKATVRLFLEKKAAWLKRAFFCIVLLYTVHADASGPAVYVEKAIETQQVKFVISSSGLPEMRSISFVCTYAVPHVTIMDAIVSSPQPSTAISVLVDTAASSFSVSIHAVSTLLPPDKAPIVILKINDVTPGVSWPLAFVKAIIIDKQGAIAELPVTIKTSLAEKFPCFSVSQNTRISAGRVILFSLNGRKTTNYAQRNAAGCYLTSMGSAYKKEIISVR